MRNSIFGKNMKNVMNRRDIKLATNDQRKKKLASEHNYHISTKMNKMNKINANINKLVYLGWSMVRRNKIVMYEYCMTLRNKCMEKLLKYSACIPIHSPSR